MGKRTFTAEYKTQVVLEVLREEKQLGEIAAEHGISPNQLRNWKREFLENASRVFNESMREKEIRAKEKELEAERAELLTTIGQLTMERDWLKKNLLKCLDLTTRIKIHPLSGWYFLCGQSPFHTSPCFHYQQGCAVLLYCFRWTRERCMC